MKTNSGYPKDAGVTIHCFLSFSLDVWIFGSLMTSLNATEMTPRVRGYDTRTLTSKQLCARDTGALPAVGKAKWTQVNAFWITSLVRILATNKDKNLDQTSVLSFCVTIFLNCFVSLTRTDIPPRKKRVHAHPRWVVITHHPAALARILVQLHCCIVTLAPLKKFT